MGFGSFQWVCAMGVRWEVRGWLVDFETLGFVSIGVVNIAGHGAIEGNEQHVVFENGRRVVHDVSEHRQCFEKPTSEHIKLGYFMGCKNLQHVEKIQNQRDLANLHQNLAMGQFCLGGDGEQVNIKTDWQVDTHPSITG